MKNFGFAVASVLSVLLILPITSCKDLSNAKVVSAQSNYVRSIPSDESKVPVLQKMKEETPAAIYNDWIPVEIRYCEDLNRTIVMYEKLRNNAVLIGYYTDNTSATIHFGIFDIKSEKFNPISFVIDKYDGKSEIKLHRQTGNQYFISSNTSDPKLYILDQDFKKVDSISLSSATSIISVSPDGSNFVYCDYTKIYRYYVASRNTEVLYSFDKKQDVVPKVEYLDRNQDILLTYNDNFSTARGSIIDSSGKVLVDAIPCKLADEPISFYGELGNKLLYSYLIGDSCFNEIGLYDIQTNSCTQLLKYNGTSQYNFYDLYDQRLLYIETNEKGASLKQMELSSGKISDIQPDIIPNYPLNDSSFEFFFSNDTKSIYFLGNYQNGGKAVPFIYKKAIS